MNPIGSSRENGDPSWRQTGFQTSYDVRFPSLAIAAK
jgi:hypothetical protein